MTRGLRRTARRVLLAVALLALVAGCVPPGGSSAPTPAIRFGSNGTPRPDHVVIVVMENHGLEQIIGSDHAPFLNQLADSGALFTEATAITHPSEPNYLALFSGDMHGILDDACPYTVDAPNLGRELLDARLGFAAYSEDLPRAGFTGCEAGDYARRHNPVPDFPNLPAEVNRPFTDFARDFAALPTVSLVVPNLCHDMHDCGVTTGDDWLSGTIGDYADWAKTNNSLLIITWDEAEDSSPTNRIPLIVTGAMVNPGRYSDPVNHYSMLRTIEDMYSLPHAGHAVAGRTITSPWTPGSTRP